MYKIPENFGLFLPNFILSGKKLEIWLAQFDFFGKHTYETYFKNFSHHVRELRIKNLFLTNLNFKFWCAEIIDKILKK